MHAGGSYACELRERLLVSVILMAQIDVFREQGLVMIGGIIVATVLTLLFLPVLYVAWYRIKEPSS
jgi:multidrug efflux pump subunit AcrB